MDRNEAIAVRLGRRRIVLLVSTRSLRFLRFRSHHDFTVLLHEGVDGMLEQIEHRFRRPAQFRAFRRDTIGRLIRIGCASMKSIN